MARLLESELVDLWPLEGRVPRVGVGLGSFLTISFLTIATLVFLAELTLWLAGDATRPVERVNLVLVWCEKAAEARSVLVESPK